MGLVSSRLNFESLHSGRRRSQQDETLYNYSLNKTYFSNYFLMGGERFEVNDPDYLFGDQCDLSFLSCTKPYSLPYKHAQHYLLAILNSKQKAISKVSSLSSPFSILTRRSGNSGSSSGLPSNARKQDAQTQTLQSTKTLGGNNSEPSKPLVMFVNIRKETLRLVKSTLLYNLEKGDPNPGQTNNISVTPTHSSSPPTTTATLDDGGSLNNCEAIEEDDEDDDFKSALNDTTVLSIKDGDDNSMEENNQQKPSKTTPSNKVYNIEFTFDAEVDCYIRIFYFCTREITSSGVSYKPQHATYKSKIYYYKKGLNQKFEQQEHTFQPYLFDEDLLIYKPLDIDGNYNSGAVFPIVIHCVAIEGPMPRQSHSLVATIEKSQLDDSYSIKPLKQLIFVDGVQYILQDIYGIEHKQLISKSTEQKVKNRKAPIPGNSNATSNMKMKSQSLQSNINISNLNLSDTASVKSVNLGSRVGYDRVSLVSQQHYKSLGSENTFECVICMSEERDTMLLPCRHLCLCSSCAQSLRYQASSCPICRCPFRAALNIRPIQRQISNSAIKASNEDVVPGKRRLSVTTSTTPLLSAPLDVVVSLDGTGGSRLTTIKIAPTPTTTAVAAAATSSSSSYTVPQVDENGSFEMRSMNVHWNKT